MSPCSWLLITIYLPREDDEIAPATHDNKPWASDARFHRRHGDTTAVCLVWPARNASQPCVKLRIELRGLLKEIELQHGSRGVGKKVESQDATSLADLGIDKHEHSRWVLMLITYGGGGTGAEESQGFNERIQNTDNANSEIVGMLLALTFFQRILQRNRNY